MIARQNGYSVLDSLPISLYAIIYFTMLDNIANILQKCKLQPGDCLLVGVSGGPDSVSLLHILHDSGFSLVAAYVNHQLRPQAHADGLFVKQFAADLGIKYISSDRDVNTFALEHSLSIEEAARTVRYRYLFEQAEKMGASAVLVGHTADDQVETILMHLLRGSGLSGLRGMEYRTLPNPWSARIPLVRPFLSTWRENIIAYLAEKKIAPVTDQSNLDTAFFRNRLRHDLLPILETYNSGVRQNLLRVGQIMQEDYSLIQQLVDQAWEANLARQGPGYLAFHRPGFLGLPVSLQRYLLRRAIAFHLPGLPDVDFECIERGMKFIVEGKPDGQVDLTAGLSITRERDLFWVASGQTVLPIDEYPSIAAGERQTVNLPSTVSLGGKWLLHAEITTDLEQVIKLSAANQDPYQVWLDGGALQYPLVVRCRASGDRIQPVGMAGHSIKVSDLMINLKLPRRSRKTWPLVCSGEHILWVPGCRLSQHALVNANSRSVVHLTLRRNISS